jgi:hypothetical protein
MRAPIVPAADVVLRAPASVSGCVYGLTGRNYLIDVGGLVTVMAEDAKQLIHSARFARVSA